MRFQTCSSFGSLQLIGGEEGVEFLPGFGDTRGAVVRASLAGYDYTSLARSLPGLLRQNEGTPAEFAPLACRMDASTYLYMRLQKAVLLH
jgi:hypothetical protein